MIVDGDEPAVEYATVVTYPPGHPSRWAGETVLMPTGGDQAMALRRADVHKDNGADVEVVQRTWRPSDWEPAT